LQEDILVIGAGIAGLACAQALKAGGMNPLVVDKARGPGGRMTTRRRDGWQADLGAQYFTAREPAFRAQVAAWAHAGHCDRWPDQPVYLEGRRGTPVADGQERWVGRPRMSAITRALSAELPLRTERRVTGLVPTDRGWVAEFADGDRSGDMPRVVVAVPAPQAAALLPEGANTLHAALEPVRMTPCWTVIAHFPQPLALGYHAAFVRDDGPLRWIARDSDKPGRPPGETWVLHAWADWSRDHLELPGERVAWTLLDAFAQVTGAAHRPAGYQAHRWRYAASARPLDAGYLLDREAGLGLCGDWCAGDRVEGAWLSGHRLGQAITG